MPTATKPFRLQADAVAYGAAGAARRKSPGVHRQGLAASSRFTVHDAEGGVCAVRFFTIPEVAGLLALSERHAWRLIHREELGSHRFGRATRISEEDLRDYIRRRREKRPKKQR
jgi:excisionase family DNA binding protein